MTGKERLQAVLNHTNADKIALDFGSTNVTGIHCRTMEALRRHYGLDDHPVYVYEPGQMLGLMENDLADALGIDTIGAFARDNAFGLPNVDWKEFRLPWGQVVMLPAKLADSIREENGTLYGYPTSLLRMRIDRWTRLAHGSSHFDLIPTAQLVEQHLALLTS